MTGLQNMQGDRFYETLPEWEPVKENCEASPPSENPQPSTSPKKGQLLRSTTTLSSSSKNDEGIQDQMTNPIDGPSQQHKDFLQSEGEECASRHAKLHIFLYSQRTIDFIKYEINK